MLSIMDISNLTATVLRRAADVQERIQSLQKEFAQLLSGVVSTVTNNYRPRGKKTMSAAVRARIAAAARARWAKIKAGKPTTGSTKLTAPRAVTTTCAWPRRATTHRRGWAPRTAPPHSRRAPHGGQARQPCPPCGHQLRHRQDRSVRSRGRGPSGGTPRGRPPGARC